MKKFFSTHYSEFSFNLSLFLLRAGLGSMLLINHGMMKLMKFSDMKNSFPDPLQVGHPTSLSLAIFAEVICTLMVILGLLTRLATLTLVIFFCIIIFIVHKNKPIKDVELPTLFLLGFFTILFCGPGKWSLDRTIGK